MKPQDILFLVILAFLLLKQKNVWLVVAGLIAILLAIPLFYLQVFFTAERLVMYAATFFLLASIFLLVLGKKSKK